MFVRNPVAGLFLVLEAERREVTNARASPHHGAARGGSARPRYPMTCAVTLPAPSASVSSARNAKPPSAARDPVAVS